MRECDITAKLKLAKNVGVCVPVNVFEEFHRLFVANCENRSKVLMFGDWNIAFAIVVRLFLMQHYFHLCH